MKNKQLMIQILLVASMIGFAVSGRLMPHPANFAPIAALGMLGGYLFANRVWGLSVVMVGMLLSDLVIGIESMEMRLAVYGGLMIAVFAGTLLKKAASNRSFFLGIPVASVASSMAFFAISNFAVWAFSGMYAHSASGLALSYINGIPFLWNTLAGDLVYSGALLGTVRLAQVYMERRNLQLEPAPTAQS
jgi:hypothetical protein